MTTVIVNMEAPLTSDLRGKIVERTVVLLAKKGLQGASFSQILAESGAPRGSLYHYFPGGKDELVLEAIAMSGAHAMAALEALEGKPADAVAAAFINLWRQVLLGSDFSAGCAIAAVTVAAQTAKLQERAGEVFRRWRLRLGALLEAGGVPTGRGNAVALSLISACEGAVILSRGERSIEPFEAVAAEQMAAVRREIGPGGE